MENKFLLTASDLCAIIKVCGESRVAELKFGDLQVSFDRSVEAVMVGQPALAPYIADALKAAAKRPEVGTSSSTPAEEIAALQRKDAAKGLIQEELDMKRDQLDQMLIENPAEAERLLAEGDLEELMADE